jgi:hypothetical protein
MKKHEVLWFGISSVVAIASLALQIIEAKNRRSYLENPMHDDIYH